MLIGGISPDFSRVLETFGDGRIQLRDAQTFEVIATLQTITNTQGYLSPGLSCDNQWLGVARAGEVGIWQVSDSAPLFHRPAQDGWTQDMDIAPVFSADRRWMAYSGYLGAVYLLDTTTWQEITLPITPTWLQRGQFSPDGKYFSVAGAVESWGGWRSVAVGTPANWQPAA